MDAVKLADALGQAQWGDVLLFKCNMPHTGVLRAVTLAQYDHCAVVAEDSDGDLCMLESCVVGVRAFPLVQRVREYAAHYADVIVWRRLLSSRTEAATERCREFVTAVDGRKYSYNVAKMVFTLRQAGLPSATADKQPPAFEDAYYCSELICAFFQHCGYARHPELLPARAAAGHRGAPLICVHARFLTPPASASSRCGLAQVDAARVPRRVLLASGMRTRKSV